jgi:hypothetical protein
MRKPILYISLFLMLQNAFGQVKINYGFGFDLRWEIVYKHGYLTNFRLGLSGGVGALLAKNYMPYLQYTQNFYQGGLGSSLSTQERYKINLESLFTKGIIIGAGRNNPEHFYKPIYTMGFLNPMPLYTTFDAWYINAVSTSVYRLNRPPVGSRRSGFNQHVGALGFGISRHFDLHYYNDGGPIIGDLGLGDNKDRFWTGGGFINWYFKNPFDGDLKKDGITPVGRFPFRKITIGFDRFTGFNQEAFEVAKDIKLNFVPYKDVKQAYYNKGRIYAGFELSSIPGATFTISRNDDDRFDIQNFLHDKKGQTFHGTLHKPTFGLNLYYTANQLTFIKK